MDGVRARRSLGRGASVAAGVVRRFGEVAALRGMSPARRAGRDRRGRRPERLRQVDAAGARLRAAGARRGHACAADPAVLMPQRDLLLPWRGALDNAALALRVRGRSRARSARAAARAAVRRASASAGFERARPARALGRDAPARRVRCARCWPASRCSASTSRSPRSTRSRARRCRPGWPARWRDEPRTVAARHARRRGGGRAGRPRRRDVAAPGPRRGRAAGRPAAPARRTDAAVVALRERALEALARDERAVIAAAASCSRCSAPGSSTPTRRRRRAHPPRPARGRAGAVERPRAAVGQLPRHRRRGRCSASSSRCVAGFALRDRAAPLARAAPLDLPAARRLADDPDRDRSRRCSSSGSASASRRSSRSSRSSASSRSSSRRSTRSRAVDPEQLKLLRTLDASRLRDLAPRRAAGRAARPLQRREDRRRRRRDRRRLRRVRRLVVRASATSSSTRSPSSRRRAPTRPSSILSAFAIALFGLLTLAERLLVPWAHDPREGTPR